MTPHSRRTFLGGAGMTVAAAVAMTLAPGARGIAPPWDAPALPPALTAMFPQGDWHVDDICGHLPRYAHPIPYMHDTSAPDLAALAAPIDRQFIV
ncbi:MAG: twin-arginine translocation signal domain-containing protein [Steroidobacteraceae bacterium]